MKNAGITTTTIISLSICSYSCLHRRSHGWAVVGVARPLFPPGGLQVQLAGLECQAILLSFKILLLYALCIIKCNRKRHFWKKELTDFMERG